CAATRPCSRKNRGAIERLRCAGGPGRRKGFPAWSCVAGRPVPAPTWRFLLFESLGPYILVGRASSCLLCFSLCEIKTRQAEARPTFATRALRVARHCRRTDGRLREPVPD